MTELKERLLDLIIAETTVGLSEDERAEIERLKKQFPDWRDDESLQLTLAAIDLSSLYSEEEIPQHLQRRILEDYEKSFAPVRRSEHSISEPQLSLSDILTSRWLGWAVACCLAAILAVNTFTGRDLQGTSPIGELRPSVAPSVADERSSLISSSSDAVVVTWSTAGETRFLELSGDIVWSNSEQRGYMRFTGLPANDRSKECYQLWIFDMDQSEKTPVDGGVFNVEADGEVIIPVDPKLHIGHPTLFAVTVEKPGGVVVSSREHIAAVAKIKI